MLWAAIILLVSITIPNVHGGEYQARRIAPNSSITTFRSVAYYVNWAIYDRKFNPQNLPADKLTHVMYAFANVKPDTGEVYLSDPWADTDMLFSSDTRNNSNTNLYGCLKQLYLLKKQNRHLKVLLSIGGLSHSSNFVIPASTALGRSTFASSAVSLVKGLGLDGIDIDWEYPTDDIQATNMVQLLQVVRVGLDSYGQLLNPPYRFTLTVACPAGPSNYQKLHVTDMDQYLDFWNFMAYDYAGNWSTVTANQANLFLSANNSASTPFDTQSGINYYISKGIPANKIVLGMPIYGRSFSSTSGLGMPFSGVGQGTWEAEAYDFKALPLSGATEFYDETTGSSYSYDATKRELISYDTIAVAKQKALWIKQMGLGGAMWWESSADKLGNLSLIQNVVQILCGTDGSALENTWNELSYPDSTYDNLRSGMADLGSALFSPSSSLTEGAHLSPSTLIAMSSFSPTTIYQTSPCTKTPSTSLSGSASNKPTTTITSTSTSTVTRCFTINSASSFLKSVSSDSGSLSISASTESSPKSMTFEASGFDSSTPKSPVSATSAKWNTSTSDTLSPTLKTPASIHLSLPNNTTTTVPHLASQIKNSTSTSSTAISLSAYNITITWPRTATQIRNSTSKPSSTAITTTLESTKPTILADSSISLSSSAITALAAPGCSPGGTCRTYNCVACPSGNCFCGVTSAGESACFQDEPCHSKCSTIDDCGPGEGCVVDSCCGPNGHCILLAKDSTWCANAGNSKRDHGGSWQGIWQGSTSCQAFHHR